MWYSFPCCLSLGDLSASSDVVLISTSLMRRSEGIHSDVVLMSTLPVASRRSECILGCGTHYRAFGRPGDLSASSDVVLISTGFPRRAEYIHSDVVLISPLPSVDRNTSS